MKFIPVDRKTWKRESTYLRFTKQVPCTFDMTVNLDITKFLQKKGERRQVFSCAVILYIMRGEFA